MPSFHPWLFEKFWVRLLTQKVCGGRRPEKLKIVHRPNMSKETE